MLHLQANYTQLVRMPVTMAPSANQECGDGGASYSVGLGLTDALWYRSGMGFSETGGEGGDPHAYMMCAPVLRTTTNGGFISPCGPLKVALSSTESRAWVEHWPLDACKGPEVTEVVQGIASSPQVDRPSTFAVSWHPT